MEATVKRLERLERENLWFKTLGCALLVLLVLGFLMGASGPKEGKVEEEVKARRFTVVDKEERSRGRLHVSDYGSLRLDLYDPEMVLRASLHLGARGSPALNFFDRKGKMRTSLGVRSDGASSLGLYDEKGLRAVLGRTKLEATRSGEVDESPLSSLVLFDEEGNVLWRAP
jgi:hypothetical protein